jgi:hypothetical protein
MSMGDAMTAMPDHLADEVAQLETVTSRTERGLTPNTECFTRVIMPLRAIIGALPSSLADSSDGDTWFCLESVMSGLYGALIALEDIDRKDHRDRRARQATARVGALRQDPHRNGGTSVEPRWP